jgi:hypothetical protein
LSAGGKATREEVCKENGENTLETGKLPDFKK